MSNEGNLDGTESKCDAHGFSQSWSITVDYYKTFEYSLKWKRPMSLRSSSRLSKTSSKSVQKGPASNAAVSQEDGNYDLINIIDGPEREAVEIVDNGLSESDGKLLTSINSGPAIMRHPTPKTLKSTPALCSACLELYQQAKAAETPIKNKLQDHDPKSLTCDHWVLIKKWMPRRLPDARKLDKVVTLGQGKQPEESPACSRQHIFLRRNLSRARLQAKKGRNESRRKRRRDDSHGCRAAKQRHLRSRGYQDRNVTNMDGESNSSFIFCSFEGSRKPQMDPMSLPEPSVPLKAAVVQAKQKTPKKTSGFRELLAQLRGHRNSIVKETC
uniref:Uncharacterized protein n=1 Tax=Nothobranchius kuhntae TaxID=321403 RepID=A0A1A8IXT3_NOTKU